jgi:hypothetical protein
MKLSTGKVAFPIEFDNGDKETIYFNPNDPNLGARLHDLKDNVLAKINDLPDVELDENGQPKDKGMVEAFKEILNIIYEEFDNAFASKVSHVIFRYVSPFGIVNGEYYMIYFFNVAMPVIEKEIRKANKKAQENMEKHIGKYRK